MVKKSKNISETDEEDKSKEGEPAEQRSLVQGNGRRLVYKCSLRTLTPFGHCFPLGFVSSGKLALYTLLMASSLLFSLLQNPGFTSPLPCALWEVTLLVSLCSGCSLPAAPLQITWVSELAFLPLTGGPCLPDARLFFSPTLQADEVPVIAQLGHTHPWRPEPLKWLLPLVRCPGPTFTVLPTPLSWADPIRLRIPTLVLAPPRSLP